MMSFQNGMPGYAAAPAAQGAIHVQDSQLDTIEGSENPGPILSPRTTLAAEAYAGIRDAAKVLNHGPTKIIPKVRKCDVTHFKNRFGANESIYAVDVLEAESTDIGLQMQDELKLRQNLPRKRVKDKAKGPKTAMPKPASQGFHFGPSTKLWILRIRIHSPALLSILSRILTGGDETWAGDQPRTFFRPFSGLILHHQRVREILANLQDRWGSPDTLDPVETPGAASHAESELDESGAKVAVDDCPQALADLRCYVKFIDEEILYLHTKFDNKSSDHGSQTKVRFHDLWYLFKVGELIHRPVGTGANKEHGNTALGNRTWRCYGKRPFWAKHRIAPAEHRSFIEEDDTERTSFGVHCYYIDYTGDEFCAVTETFEIPPFKGERPIKSLKVFPYRFTANYQSLQASALKNGEKFLKSIKTRHASYNGWTTTATPRGGPTTDVEGNEVKRPEFVDSEIIVDFVEAFQTCPAWKPEANVVKPEEPNPQTALDDFTTCWWSDANRTKLLGETSEIIVLRTGVTTMERNNNLDPDIPSADKFLVKIRENDKHGILTTEDDLRKDPNDPHCDLPLLPSRIFAYVLRDRKFVQLVVQQLRPVKISDDAFKYLKIDPEHKEVIQSLVQDHFEKKSSDRSDGVNIGNFDLIKGKGKGLTILLHGVPGVGKTATAEAIAAACGKPLFPITCGDLGLTPTDVEAALLRIFRLADTWNCVLLLDEVDTFFSQRSKGDATVAKNALVSVFLRVLEYYDGLLFLTTNRPGALDEAFSSRIHLAFYYPQLDLDQTMEIWNMNILRLENIEKERYEKSKGVEPLKINKKQILRFAKEKFKEQLKAQNRQKSVRWNGRQIRNAFQIASSLAHYEARRDGSTPTLALDHFKTIHSITEDFNRFMYETHGKTSSEQAFERGDRADHMDGRQRSDAEDGHSDGYGDGDRWNRRASLDKHRSPSPNVAAVRAQAARPQGSIFGSRGPPARSPARPQLDRNRPSIEVTGARGRFPRRDSDRSEPIDGYLSPTATKNQEGWYNPGRSERRAREQSESDGQRKRRRPNSESEDADMS